MQQQRLPPANESDVNAPHARSKDGRSPFSGLPDYGTLTVRYLPSDGCIELKSLKYYLTSYRNVGIYQEHAVNRVLDDLVACCAPKWMEVVLDYRLRGGIHTVVTVEYGEANST